MVHSGKGLISVFQGFSASVGKAFWWGDWGLGYETDCTSYGLLFTLHKSYELLCIARVTSYFLHTSYELLLIARVTS